MYNLCVFTWNRPPSAWHRSWQGGPSAFSWFSSESARPRPAPPPLPAAWCLAPPSELPAKPPTHNRLAAQVICARCRLQYVCPCGQRPGGMGKQHNLKGKVADSGWWTETHSDLLFQVIRLLSQLFHLTHGDVCQARPLQQMETIDGKEEKPEKKRQADMNDQQKSTKGRGASSICQEQRSRDQSLAVFTPAYLSVHPHTLQVGVLLQVQVACVYVARFHKHARAHRETRRAHPCTSASRLACTPPRTWMRAACSIFKPEEDVTLVMSTHPLPECTHKPVSPVPVSSVNERSFFAPQQTRRQTAGSVCRFTLRCAPLRQGIAFWKKP